MTAKKHFGFLSLFCLLAVISLTGCGSGEDPFDPNAIPPSITGLDRNAAAIGQDVVITGLRFGNTRGNSTVTLNGLSFQIQEFKLSNDVPPVQVPRWTDTEITVTVAEGMTSGIVVVKVDGVSSQSGSKAQLFIPVAPVGAPLISAISPDYGREGTIADTDPETNEFANDDQIMITGINFGDGSGDSGVYFPAQDVVVGQGSAVSQAHLGVLAPVVSVLIEEVYVLQWSSSAIKVTVPDGSVSGKVYVVVNGEKSNEVAFSVLPKQLAGAPIIFSQDHKNDEQVAVPGLDPILGGVGTAVFVRGENFGAKQGNSTIKINDILMDVITWATGEIVAKVPAGAVSGPIAVTVNKQSARSIPFTVENQPVISGIIPSAMRVGQPLSVVGQFFGSDQGTLKVGNTTVAVDYWSENEISVSALPVLTYSGDGTSVPVRVTAAGGQWAEAFGSIDSSLTVFFLPPNPSQGEAGTTEFTINVTVLGGSGSYQLTLIPDAEDGTPPAMDPPVIFPAGMKHVYPVNKAPGPGATLFQTQIKVTDTNTQDEVIVDGPILTVVPQGQGVITSIELLNFNNGTVPAPKNNPFTVYSYEDPPASGIMKHDYYDFTFFGGDVFYGSPRSEYDDGGDPITGFTRDYSAFMSGSPTAKPYAYRYHDALGNVVQGSVVRITGLNLGATGDIYFNSTGLDVSGLGIRLDPVNILPDSWSPEVIDFYLPNDETQSLSGYIAVVTAETSVLSTTPLICSALKVSDIAPPQPIALDGSFSISAWDLEPWDLEPPVTLEMIGEDTYFIFYVQANYTDPFTDLPDSGPALLASPVPADPSGPQVTFNMSTIPAMGTVEVFNGDFSQARYAQGTLIAGDWQAFLWTGAISEGSDFVKANSGIFGESFALSTKDGSGPPVDNWDISGMTRDDGFPNLPVGGITVNLESITGPAYSRSTTSAGDGTWSFTDVPGEEQYTVEASGGGFLWPGPRNVPNTGVLTQDEVDIWISALFT